MEDMSITPETSQPDRSWLKDAAPRNMEEASVTPEASQPDRSCR